jgi:hypothetical protein
MCETNTTENGLQSTYTFLGDSILNPDIAISRCIPTEGPRPFVCTAGKKVEPGRAIEACRDEGSQHNEFPDDAHTQDSGAGFSPGWDAVSSGILVFPEMPPRHESGRQHCIFSSGQLCFVKVVLRP